MEFKDHDHKRSNHIQRRASEGLRRPFGVAGIYLFIFPNCKILLI